MRKLFGTMFAVMIAMSAITSISQADERDLVGQILGQGFGAYGGAKLCGGNTAKQVACGTVGGILGGALFKSRVKQPYQSQTNQRYPVQQPYQEPRNHYVPRVPTYTQQCHQVAISMPNGTYGTGLMCRMSNGAWQIVSVNPVN